MKKILILSLLSLSLFAGVKQVQTYYDAKEYKEAITEAKASSDDFSNPHLHLLWAKSAEALGHENEAMSAYERVEMLDKNNIEARIALAKLYKRTGRDDLARTEAKSLQNYQLTPQQRNSLDSLRGINVHSFKAYASLAVGHDTNINIASEELTGASGEALSTMFAQFSGSLSYINEIEDKGGWYARGDLQLYNQTNFDSNASLYDLFLGGLSVGAGYAGDGYNIYIPIGYDSINYLEKNLFTQIKLQPRINYILSNELIFSGDLNYVARSYTTDDNLNNRDDNTYGLGMGAYYLLGKDFIYLKAKYENSSADIDVVGVEYVDKTALSMSLGANYNLVSWLVVKADYRFRLGSYDDNDRSDKFNQVGIKFSHYFAKMFEAYVSDTYAKNSSNISDKEYTKNIFMFGIALNY